jgi:hypothetical protein
MDKFKSKYHKYKTKYLNLINEIKIAKLKIAKMKGGIREDEFVTFKNELIDIYQLVFGKVNPICIGGSSEIAYLLHRLGLTTDLDSMNIPGDIDLMFNGYINDSKTFGDFLPVQNSPGNSRTWKDTQNKYQILKSFDLTGNGNRRPNIDTLTSKIFTLIDFNSVGKEVKLNFLNLNTLKKLYEIAVGDIKDKNSPEFKRKNARLTLIDIIIKKIKDEHLLNEYGLDENVADRKKYEDVTNKKRHHSSIFDINPLISLDPLNLFGDSKRYLYDPTSSHSSTPNNSTLPSNKQEINLLTPIQKILFED